MKIKVLAVLGLAAVAGLAGCRGAANTNANVMVTNTTTMNTNMMMSTPMSTPMATDDAATRSSVEAALKKAGMMDVAVSATTTEVTLRGTVAKGKLGEAVRVATEAAGGKKKINNELKEK